MNFFKKVMPFALGLLLVTGAVFAQGQQGDTTDVSDQELEMLSDIAVQQQQISGEAQMQMQQAVKAEDKITIQRYGLIMRARQNPNTPDTLQVSSEEEQAITNLQPKMGKIRQQANQKIQAALQESELTQQRIQQLQAALQGNQQLMQRFQKMMMQKMQSNQAGDGNGKQ